MLYCKQHALPSKAVLSRPRKPPFSRAFVPTHLILAQSCFHSLEPKGLKSDQILAFLHRLGPVYGWKPVNSTRFAT